MNGLHIFQNTKFIMEFLLYHVSFEHPADLKQTQTSFRNIVTSLSQEQINILFCTFLVYDECGFSSSAVYVIKFSGTIRRIK